MMDDVDDDGGDPVLNFCCMLFTIEFVDEPSVLPLPVAFQCRGHSDSPYIYSLVVHCAVPTRR